MLLLDAEGYFRTLREQTQRCKSHIVGVFRRRFAASCVRSPLAYVWLPSIPRLLRAVKKHAKEQWMILYIERWLKAPVQEEDGRLVAREKGTPQGEWPAHS